MRLLTSLAFVAAAAVAASVSATDCDLTTLASVAFTDEYDGCVSDSGYSLEAALADSAIEPPTTAQMLKMCMSSSCMTLLDTVESLGLGDCTVGSYALESDIIDVARSQCEESGLTPSDVGDGSSSSSSTTGGVKLSTGAIIGLAAVNSRRPLPRLEEASGLEASCVAAASASSLPSSCLRPPLRPEAERSTSKRLPVPCGGGRQPPAIQHAVKCSFEHIGAAVEFPALSTHPKQDD